MRKFLPVFIWMLSCGFCSAQDDPGNRFVFAQLRVEGAWDPYPQVWESVNAFLQQYTSVRPWPERRVVGAEDAALFQYPFLVWAGRGQAGLSERAQFNLRHYLAGGGFLFIDNSEGEKNSAFARSVLPLLEKLFPNAAWEPVPPGHAVFRSFFLLKAAAGRRMADPALMGLKIQDRLVAVYCANDVLGAWARDPLGRPQWPCEPGGEVQRVDSMKLMANIALFSLTGTYKTDAIHQPFIERKLTP